MVKSHFFSLLLGIEIFYFILLFYYYLFIFVLGKL